MRTLLGTVYVENWAEEPARSGSSTWRTRSRTDIALIGKHVARWLNAMTIKIRLPYDPNNDRADHHPLVSPTFIAVDPSVHGRPRSSTAYAKSNPGAATRLRGTDSMSHLPRTVQAATGPPNCPYPTKVRARASSTHPAGQIPTTNRRTSRTGARTSQGRKIRHPGGESAKRLTAAPTSDRHRGRGPRHDRQLSSELHAPQLELRRPSWTR